MIGLAAASRPRPMEFPIRPCKWVGHTDETKKILSDIAKQRTNKHIPNREAGIFRKGQVNINKGKKRIIVDGKQKYI